MTEIFKTHGLCNMLFDLCTHLTIFIQHLTCRNKMLEYRVGWVRGGDAGMKRRISWASETQTRFGSLSTASCWVIYIQAPWNSVSSLKRWSGTPYPVRDFQLKWGDICEVPSRVPGTGQMFQNVTLPSRKCSGKSGQEGLWTGLPSHLGDNLSLWAMITDIGPDVLQLVGTLWAKF